MQKRKTRSSEFNTLEMLKLLLTFTTFTLSCFFYDNVWSNWKVDLI